MPDKIHWRRSLEEAREEARRDGKLVLIEILSAQCGASQTMERITFSDEGLQHAMARSFAGARFSVLEQPGTMVRFNTSWTPTFIVQDAEGREHRRCQGYLNARRFLGEMTLARLQAALNRQEFAQAQALIGDALTQTRGDAAREPEAMYWAAVAEYQACGDHACLVGGWSRLLYAFPQSEWAQRASFIHLRNGKPRR